jgi:exodeoxyribonuclease-3
MRVVSISLDGLKQAAEAGFFEWMREIDADVVCIQDLRGRLDEFDAPVYHPDDYHAFFIDAGEPEQGGVGIYSRFMPKAIIYGFNYGPADQEGRFIQADFEQISVASILAPCALGAPERQAHKDAFMEALKQHLEKTLRKRRQFLFCGNLQSAHLVMDASPYHHSQDSISGFLPHERAWFDDVFERMGYLDAFRQISLQKKQFTWWPKWAGEARANAGWRTDYQIASASLKPMILDGFIDFDTRFCEHAPLVMEYATRL